MRQHPWVFSGAIKKIEGYPTEGDIVDVHANKGRFLGRGLYSDASISVRILSFNEEEEIDDEFFKNAIDRAWRLRESIGITEDEGTNIFRLVHAEGDNLPGLVVDVYGKTAILQAHAPGMHMQKEIIAKQIVDSSKGRILSVFDKSGESLPKNYENKPDPEYIIKGDNDMEEEHYLENGYKFNIDWKLGQKTGFFIDQRDNRLLLGSLAKGKSVLNTFCYTGGFSIYALQNGASLVHSVDSSQSALDILDKNIELNGFADDRHKTIKADAMQFVKDLPLDYDIIILDPPAFAKHVKNRHNAIQGYKRLNSSAISQIKPGGILFTYSCSQVITQKIFRDTITAAAINVGRQVKILHQMTQPADHPINIFHPESEYLKGLVLYIE